MLCVVVRANPDALGFGHRKLDQISKTPRYRYKVEFDDECHHSWSMTHRAGALSPVTLKAMLLQTSYLFNLKLYLAHLSRPCPRNRTLDTTISKQVLQEQQHKHMMLQSQDRASIWVHLQKSANWIALRSPMEIAYLALGTVDCPGN